MSGGGFERFAELCLEDRQFSGSDADAIGTYNEKRFHRVFKRFVTEDADCYEVKVGPYCADVLCDGHITEIQTRGFSSLKKKLEYYLEHTDHTVSVVKPLICEKTIVRADRETGEIKYVRRSPKKEGLPAALRDIYAIREFLNNERLRIHLVSLRAEEYRYSERVRYRRSGAYDKDLFPLEITEETVLCGAKDYEFLLFDKLEDLEGKEFTAKDYSMLMGFDVGTSYSALNVLADIGLLTRRTEGRRHYFAVKSKK